MVFTEPFFPLELVEYLARFLWIDNDTLRAVSSTCRAWRSIALPYLYRGVAVHTEHQLHSLERRLGREPSISPWIREVRIDAVPFYPLSYYGPVDMPWIYKVPKKLPKLLPRLHAIHISGVERPTWHYAEWTFFPNFRRFTSVRSLILSKCTFPADVIQEIIYCLPQLTTLRLCDVSFSSVQFDDDMNGVAPPKYHQPRLTSLCIRKENLLGSYSLADILGWIYPTESMLTLRDFHVCSRYPSDLPLVGSFISALGSVHHLCLEFGQSESWGDNAQRYEDTMTYLDLSHNTGLRSLNLHIDPLFAGVNWLLSSVKSAHLHTLTFAVTFKNLRSIKPHDFLALDESLCSSHLRSLREIRFYHMGSMKGDLLANKLRRCLPRAQRQGVVINVFQGVAS